MGHAEQDSTSNLRYSWALSGGHKQHLQTSNGPSILDQLVNVLKRMQWPYKRKHAWTHAGFING